MDSTIGIAGIGVGAGVGVGYHGLRETDRARHIATAGLLDVSNRANDALLKVGNIAGGSAASMDATWKAGINGLDYSFETARQPTDRMLDHMLNGKLGPLSIFGYIQQTRELGRAAKFEADNQIAISRGIIANTESEIRATALQAVADTRGVTTQAIADTHAAAFSALEAAAAPARRGVIALAVGGVLAAAGMGAAMVAAGNAINKSID